jgi:hypothetical protein
VLVTVVLVVVAAAIDEVVDEDTFHSGPAEISACFSSPYKVGKSSEQVQYLQVPFQSVQLVDG